MSELREQQPQDPTEITLKILDSFPEGLRTAALDFFSEVTRSLLAQNTSMVGDEPVVRISEGSTEFYKKRFREIVDSGLINRHEFPPKEIK